MQMTESAIQITPKWIPPLETAFVPAALFNRAFRRELESSGQGVPLILGVERTDGTLSRYETCVFADQHPWSKHNKHYVERIVKFLLWQRGGYKVYVGGPAHIGAFIKETYSPSGDRKGVHQRDVFTIRGSQI
jgi:hypothetical protein